MFFSAADGHVKMKWKCGFVRRLGLYYNAQVPHTQADAIPHGHTHLQFLTYTNIPQHLFLSVFVCLGLSAHDRVLCVPINHHNAHTSAQG